MVDKFTFYGSVGVFIYNKINVFLLQVQVTLATISLITFSYVQIPVKVHSALRVILSH